MEEDSICANCRETKPEDEVVFLGNGKAVCEHCLAGRLTTLSRSERADAYYQARAGRPADGFVVGSGRSLGRASWA